MPALASTEHFSLRVKFSTPASATDHALHARPLGLYSGEVMRDWAALNSCPDQRLRSPFLPFLCLTLLDLVLFL